uniref:Ornithine cyclodeaminase n=1 Tax=Angomonas desouzai TaxID=59800 RepID=U5KM06_9TRYP|nr:ornithine cyclodeaminase [Angomonas desouzai]
MSKLLFIDGEKAKNALPMGVLLTSLKGAFKSGCEVPLRHSHIMNNGSTLLMPAWDKKYYGLKTVNIYPENGKRGLPGLHSTFQLFDAQTGKPLAVIDGDTITCRRTAAAAALGASFLARKDSSVHLLVGAGRVASLVPEAMKAAIPSLKKFLVWNYIEDEATRLVASLKKQGFDAEVCKELKDGCGKADIVTCATLSRKPLVHAEWLKPNSHLDLIGSFTPAMMETNPECFANAAVYVDTMEAPTKSGDLLEAFKAGALKKEEIVSTLEELCRGEKKGRTSNEGRTVFKAVGTALEDLAAAVVAYEAVSGSKL